MSFAPLEAKLIRFDKAKGGKSLRMFVKASNKNQPDDNDGLFVGFLVVVSMYSTISAAACLISVFIIKN